MGGVRFSGSRGCRQTLCTLTALAPLGP
jgi:hypothetical protein